MKLQNTLFCLVILSISQQISGEIVLKPFLHSNTERKLASYLNEISVSSVPLVDSIWREVSEKIASFETCKVCSVHPNLAKMIRIEDGCLDNVMSNKSKAFYGHFQANELKIEDQTVNDFHKDGRIKIIDFSPFFM